MLQKGADMITKGAKEDKNHNYDEALRCYVQGAVLLLQFEKYNIESEKTKYLVEERCEQLISRIKKLKDFRNRIHGAGVDLDKLETMLSDNNMLYVMTEIICMCGDYMDLGLMYE